jgi:hypothetical protein
MASYYSNCHVGGNMAAETHVNLSELQCHMHFNEQFMT